MATMFDGLFDTPEDIQNRRIDSMMQNRRAISNMGGGWSQLLGQVAAGGGATGEMLAEGAGRMFGLQTEEEKKADEIQAMMSTAMKNMDDPAAVSNMARLLNERGYTKEALALMEIRSQRLGDQLTQERIDASKAGTGQIVSVQTGNREDGAPIYTYYKYNSRTGKMEEVGSGYRPISKGSGSFLDAILAQQLAGGATGTAPNVVVPDKGATAAGAGRNNLNAWRKTFVALPEEQTNPYYIPEK